MKHGNIVEILGVKVDNIGKVKALELTKEFIEQGGFHHVITPGPEFLLEAKHNNKFKEILNRADLSLADGMGIHIGALLQGKRIKQRIPGVDYVEALLEIASEHKYRLFILGGQGKVGESAAIKIIDKYPNINIVGVESGHRGWWLKIHDQRIIDKIYMAKPDILLVAFGAPKQELWIDKHRKVLHQVKVAVGVGRTLDYISGKIKRPPKIIRLLGFEWLYTYIFASQFHQPELRRQRVKNATWHYLKEVINDRKESNNESKG